MNLWIGIRDVVEVSGPEAVSYLQGQVSQDVMSLAVGASARSFILQPQGKVDAWFRITRAGDDSFLLDVDAGFGETLVARLQRFKLRTKVDITLSTWTWHAYRDGAPAVAEAPIVAPVDWNGAGLDVIGPDLATPEDVDLLSDDAFTRRRILAGVPAMGSELNDDTIPAEAGVVDESVSFTKGCYTGQELVARVDSRGNNTPRNLRLVSGPGAVPPEATFESLLGDAGRVTSAATDTDGWVGLAYIKRSVEVPSTVGDVAITEIGAPS